MAPVFEEEVNSSSKVSYFASYGELAAQNYFNPEKYDAHLITDNPGTHVFIFHAGGRQAYKTIFTKQDSRLKVIDIANNKLVMNEQIN